MRDLKRFAGKAWDSYKDNLWVQDIIETTVMALGIAGAQALFSEMTPEEIALSGVVGVGAGMAGRPVGHAIGQRTGRFIDKQFPEHSAGLKTKLDSGMDAAEKFGAEYEAARPFTEFMKAKLKHHISDDAGFYESGLSYLGRQRGDNLAQAGVGALAPMVIGNNPAQTPQQQQQPVI